MFTITRLFLLGAAVELLVPGGVLGWDLDSGLWLWPWPWPWPWLWLAGAVVVLGEPLRLDGTVVTKGSITAPSVLHVPGKPGRATAKHTQLPYTPAQKPHPSLLTKTKTYLSLLTKTKTHLSLLTKTKTHIALLAKTDTPHFTHQDKNAPHLTH